MTTAQEPARRRGVSAPARALLLCLLLLSGARLSAQQQSCKGCTTRTVRLAVGEATLVAAFDGPGLFATQRLRSRIKRWGSTLLLRSWFSRSRSFKLFVRKTRVRDAALVMNAGLAFFDPESKRFTHVVATLTEQTQIILAFRASLTEWGPSDLALTRLDAHWRPLPGAGVVLARAHRIGNGWYGPPWREDPRLVPTRQGLAVAYTVSCAYERNRHGFQVWQRQGFSLLDDRNGTLLSGDIFFSIGNNSDFKSTIFPTFEKNWLFFEHAGSLHVIYSTQPFCVYRIADWAQRTSEQVLCTPWRLAAGVVELRGSTPPVRVGDSLFMFAHSWTYDVYAIAFSATTLAIEAVSATPLLHMHARRPFVCGALYVSGDRTWFLSVGINDVSIAIFKLHHSALLTKLKPVELL
jgi:hypothetical protein